MTNHADLIAALRIPMNVTLPGAPELDEYDEQRKAAADVLDSKLSFEHLRPYGFAPGPYSCFCSECGIQHTADKRAWRCLTCAEKRTAQCVDVDVIEQAISDVAQEGGSVREQAEYVLKCIATRPTSEVWAEATAAAYGAAHDIAKSWFHNVGKGTPYAEIEAITPQSARDWLTTHDAKAYRRGQEDMRERAADVLRDKWASTSAEHEAAIRALPIKEKYDE